MKIQMKNKACVYFHQGWTDIIMCMALINHYKELYDEISVIIRSDAKELVDFYVKNLHTVKIIYIDTDNGRFYGQIDTNYNGNDINYMNNVVLIPKEYDIMFHAEHDRYRKDGYTNLWNQPFRHKPTNHFSEMFYVFYDIDFNTRISKFNIERDLLLEEKTYNKFIEQHGVDYVIYHDDNENSKHGSHHVSTSIEFNNKISDCSYVNLNKTSKIFFDYIKIFQKAKEIHLVDSIWGCLLYQLDAKYGILDGKEVNLYCKRGHENLFQFPIKLDNWKLIK